MNYMINPTALASAFLMPSSVVDASIKLASHTQLKVLLCFLRNLSNGADQKSVAEFLGLPESEVGDALEFWAQAGVLNAIGSRESAKAEAPAQEKSKPAVRPQTVKPTREEIFSAAASDETLAWLLREAEMKLARSLRLSEMQTLAWLYLDHGMDASLILTLIAYAIEEGKPTTAFIEGTALKWIENGVSTLSEADAYINERNMRKTAWGMVEKAFGIEHRMPSEKELTFANDWVVNWGFSREMLREAYNRCIDKNAKISMAYINSILKSWFEKGIKTPEDIEKESAAPKAKSGKKSDDGFGAYDKSLVNKLLNSDDDEE